jgi:hypothetical protein
MELRLHIDDAFMGRLQEALGYVKGTDVVREALTILNWAVQERQRGRLILSATKNGQGVAQLAMPSLDRVAEETDGGRAA